MSKLYAANKKYFEDALRSEDPAIAINILKHKTLVEKGLTYDQAYELFKEFYENDISKPIRKTVKDFIGAFEQFNKYRKRIVEAWRVDWKARIKDKEFFPLTKALVLQLSKEGMSKKEIYGLFLEFYSFTGYSDDYSENQEEVILDFLDGFTSWAKGNRILPDEPDV
jgi:hypothetical protein